MEPFSQSRCQQARREAVARISILSFSDGRRSVHDQIKGYVADEEAELARSLEEAGHHVDRAGEIVWTQPLAVREARTASAARPDLTIFNIPVWAFPHLAAVAAVETAGPLLLFASSDPQQPGMVGMLAAGGALDQVGRSHTRLCGRVGDPAIVAAISSTARAGQVVGRLRGARFGRIGGRPMGMYTAVSNSDQWLRKFGIDVEEIDQWELVRRAEAADPAELRGAREWLERLCAGVEYDGRQLTPQLLERQIGIYVAMRELIEENALDFSGIKGQPELTTHFATADVAEAFLNDPYDWNGAKAGHVCATEADMDGALTMFILSTLSGTPALFADIRHHDEERGIWDLCNSGQHATWFAERSDDAAVNLARVRLHPEVFFFPAGGASVEHIAAPGDFTFARLTRLDGRYRLHLLRGALERYDEATNRELAARSTPEWPHAFARLDGVDAAEFVARYGSNHIHAVPGDHVAELEHVCRMLDVDVDPFGAAAS
jgi:L-fucose isomerase